MRLVVSTEYTNVHIRQTDRQGHSGIAYRPRYAQSCGKN